MTADRLVPTSAAPSPVPGGVFMDAVQEELTRLYNASALRLSSVAGTANAITATVAPALTAGLADGMAFHLTPLVDNTGAATVAIGALAPVDVVDSAGAALSPGALKSGLLAELLFNGTTGKLQLKNSAQVVKVLNQQAFTASGTWTKPAGTPADAWVFVECWGGGGGGHNAASFSGGGGGGYNYRIMRAGDLGGTVAVTIGAGGAIASGGGLTTFGAHLSAYGGAAGSASAGGGGGGQLAAGSGAQGGGPCGGRPGDATYASGFGVGGGAGGTTTSPSTVGGDGWFGGGGGGSTPAGPGGASAWGGGGGGGASGQPGGISMNGGNGGASGAAGSAPAGGGGSNAAGARGECRVRVIG